MQTCCVELNGSSDFPVRAAAPPVHPVVDLKGTWEWIRWVSRGCRCWPEHLIHVFLLGKQRNSWHLGVTFRCIQAVHSLNVDFSPWSALTSTPTGLDVWSFLRRTQTAGSRPGFDTVTSVSAPQCFTVTVTILWTGSGGGIDSAATENRWLSL